LTINLSVCIEMIFADRPFEERIGCVAEAGLPAIEFWDWPDKDIARIDELCQRYGLQVAAFVMEPRGRLVHAEEPDQLREAVQRSIDAARALGCRNLIALVGRESPGLSRAEQHENVVRGLSEVAPLAEAAGVTLLVEPLNVLVDHAGFFLSSSQEAFQIVEEVGSANVKVLFDLYHQQVSEGNLTANIVAHLDRVGHIHAADVPGRHQPGTGEINYANVLRQVSQAGYSGYLGLEFQPSGDSFHSLQAITEIVDQVNRQEHGS
jgi:hydroxypyruvate isomerase